MIAAWMLYTIGVTLLLLAAAGVAEYVVRALRAPTRLVWSAAMAVAIALSARALITGSQRHPARRASTAVIHSSEVMPNDSPPSSAGVRRESWPTLTSRLVEAVRSSRRAIVLAGQFATRFDAGRLDAWNAALVTFWITTSGAAFLLMFASVVRLHRITQSLTTVLVHDQPILVSPSLGPAVVGILRSRVVLPTWALTLPPRERDIILTHEREHSEALDPALLAAAIVLAALQPWNVALWGLVARLRLAIEADCDRRVLRAMRHETGRSYARLLVSVYERATVGTSFSVGFVARLSNLERRIHRILRTPRLGSWSSVLSSLAAFTLIVTACAATAPVRHQVPLSGPMVDTSVLPPPNAPAGVGSSAQPVAPPARTSVAAGPARASFETQAPVPGSSPQTRCTLAERRRVEAGGQHIVLWPRQWPVSAGCTLYGEIVAIQLDSVNLLAAVRDTADKDVSAFFVFRTEPGSTTRDVAWATTTGHASLSDTTMSFSINATRPLIMQLQNSTVVGHVSALELKIDEMLMAEMSGVPWELITGLRGAPRCEPMERGEGTADAGNTTERMARTCFLSRGQRFDVPVFRAR